MLFFPHIFRWKVRQCFSHFCPSDADLPRQGHDEHSGALRAILLSPYGAELASLRLQRFGPSLAFSASCCPLSLSESGQPVFLEYPSNSSRLHRRSHRAWHGARSQHRHHENESRYMHIGLEDAPYLSIQSSEEKTGPEMSSQRLIELSTISHGCTCWGAAIGYGG